ncbi:MAG: glycosyltransferase N-terminal domain-containing protein [bacterium]|nr:glycosyltransferase N-terminal domain-containing protein [bacterium]
MDILPLYQLVFYLPQRLFSPLKIDEIPEGEVDIWVHCSSLGEVMAAKPLVDCFLMRQLRVLMTVFTSSGSNKAQELWKGKVKILRFPLDSYFHLKKIIDRTKPKIFVNLETELWPNLLTLIGKNNIIAFLVNGRISERNFRKSRLIKGTYKRLLKSFVKIYAQTEEDKERFIKLGAREEQVEVAGNIKIDSIGTSLEGFKRENLGIGDGDFVILFGSLREKEERHAVRVIQKVLSMSNVVRVFIAPRHLNRVAPIASQLSSLNINFARWSESGSGSKGVVIIDVLGKLRSFYNIADLVVMGGTFAPYGGHNIMEPVSAGKAVIVGPFYGNIKKEVEELKERNAVFVLKTSEELLDKIIELMGKRDLLREVGERATKWLISKQGISRRICEEILLHLEKSGRG